MVHLKVDTGMARLGVTTAELPAFAAALSRFPEVHISGLMTHLACADAASDEELTTQMVRFDEATVVLAKHGVRPPLRCTRPTAQRSFAATPTSTRFAQASRSSASPRRSSEATSPRDSSSRGYGR